MNEATPVTSRPGDLARLDETSQSDRATLVATGWSSVVVEPRRAKPLRTRQPAAVATGRSPWRRRAQALSLSVALFSALILMAWIGLGSRLHAAVAASPASSEPAVVHCSPASAGLVAALKAGLADPHAGDLRYVSLVQSPADARMYFVAATIAGTGWDSKVGLWATDDPSGGSPIYAVNENAIRDSTWPDARTTGTHLSEVDDGADVAMACGDG